VVILTTGTFAANRGNHCENLPLDMQSFNIAEQHRADCHESNAVSALKGLTKSVEF
jgi:hypothetical protein